MHISFSPTRATITLSLDFVGRIRRFCALKQLEASSAAQHLPSGGHLATSRHCKAHRIHRWNPNSNIECRLVNARPRASTREASLTWTTSQPVYPTVARRRKMKTRLTYRCQLRILDVQLDSGPRCAKPEELAGQYERRPRQNNYIELSTIDHGAFKYPGTFCIIQLNLFGLT